VESVERILEESTAPEGRCARVGRFVRRFLAEGRTHMPGIMLLEPTNLDFGAPHRSQGTSGPLGQSNTDQRRTANGERRTANDNRSNAGWDRVKCGVSGATLGFSGWIPVLHTERCRFL